MTEHPVSIRISSIKHDGQEVQITVVHYASRPECADAYTAAVKAMTPAARDGKHKGPTKKYKAREKKPTPNETPA